jgi:hypothetical protein
MRDFHLLLLRRDTLGADVVIDSVVDWTADKLDRALQTGHPVGTPMQRTTPRDRTGDIRLKRTAAPPGTISSSCSTTTLLAVMC